MTNYLLENLYTCAFGCLEWSILDPEERIQLVSLCHDHSALIGKIQV